MLALGLCATLIWKLLQPNWQTALNRDQTPPTLAASVMQGESARGGPRHPPPNPDAHSHPPPIPEDRAIRHGNRPQPPYMADEPQHPPPNPGSNSSVMKPNRRDDLASFAHLGQNCAAHDRFHPLIIGALISGNEGSCRRFGRGGAELPVLSSPVSGRLCFAARLLQAGPRALGGRQPTARGQRCAVASGPSRIDLSNSLGGGAAGILTADDPGAGMDAVGGGPSV